MRLTALAGLLGAVLAATRASAIAPPDDPALTALKKRAAALAAVMGKTDVDGDSPAAPSWERKPVYSARAAADQGALASFLKSERKPPIEVNGFPGKATRKAVEAFQKKKGLPVNGLLDRATETTLLSDFQARRKLKVTGTLDEETLRALPPPPRPSAAAEPRYYSGSASDFKKRSSATTIKNVRATVYTPFRARTRQARKQQGSHVDRHDQTICTLERYLHGVCPYVSVAIDSRLKVPNGTPLLIPEISALVGATVPFRIVDTGSKKLFKGTRHIDIATDSDQYEGLGRMISDRRYTLILPRGLHPHL
jgi:hypothetical protein